MSDSQLSQIILKDQIQTLYHDYALCLDQDNLDKWITFFTDSCIYRVTSQENYKLNLPIAAWHSEGTGMLNDRILALRNSTLYRPRYFRHIISGIKIDRQNNDVIYAQANVLLVETVIDFKTQILLSGRYIDQIIFENDQYKFKEKVCVYDSVLLPTSLVYPV